jgi:hypothetical protein
LNACANAVLQSVNVWGGASNAKALFESRNGSARIAPAQEMDFHAGILQTHSRARAAPPGKFWACGVLYRMA